MALDRNDWSKNPGFALSETAFACSSKIVEFGFMNATAAFDGARKLASVESPQAFFEVLTDLTREQFERLSEQVGEISALMQSGSPLKNENTTPGFWE